MKNYNEVNVGDNLVYYDGLTDKRYSVVVVEKKICPNYHLIKVKLTNEEDRLSYNCVGAICASRNYKFNNLY
jgi:hypothetical protein